jgi:cobaltochelatase CobN
MHVLALHQGVIGDGNTAVDLEQPPGEVIILSAADTDLACIAAAHDALGNAAPSVRLANLLQLQHNMSVDIYVDRTLAGAKLVIVRLLGGRSYWTYGLDSVCARARDSNIKLVVIPGEAGPDPALSALSSIDPVDVEYFRTAFAYGGSANASKVLLLARHLIDAASRPEPPEDLPLSGFYRKTKRTGGAVVVFYRALVQSGFTDPINVLSATLEKRGLGATCLFVQSLKDASCADFVRSALRESAPAVIVNATGFAVGSESGGQDQNPFATTDCPVLQAVFSGS